MKSILIAATCAMFAVLALGGSAQAALTIPPPPTVEICDLGDRSCWPSDDPIGYCAGTPPPTGGIVGATYSYATDIVVLTCNGAIVSAAYGSGVTGDAGHFAWTETVDTLGWLGNNPVYIGHVAQYGLTATLMTIGEGSGQATLACHFLIGASPLCYAFSGANDPAPAWCFIGGGNGGIVGETIAYAVAAGNSACGYAEQLAAITVAEANLIAGQVDALASSATGHVLDTFYDTRTFYLNQLSGARQYVYYVGDMTENASDRTCGYLVGVPCPTIYIQTARAAVGF